MGEFDFPVSTTDYSGAFHTASQPCKLSLESSISFSLRSLLHISLLELSATPPSSDSQLMTSHFLSWEEKENQRELLQFTTSKSINSWHIPYPPPFHDDSQSSSTPSKCSCSHLPSWTVWYSQPHLHFSTPHSCLVPPQYCFWPLTSLSLCKCPIIS